MNVLTSGTRRVQELRHRVPVALRPHIDRIERAEIHLRDLARQLAELWTTAQRLEAAQAEAAERQTRSAEEMADLRAALQGAQAEHAQQAAELQRRVDDLRSVSRLTQAMLEQQPETPPTSGDEPRAEPSTTAAPTRPERRFDHATPSFDVLYRAFEDRYRGSRDVITDRQSTDYLEILTELPRPDLTIVDLGCGRGELVRLLDDAGQPALGVDANHGQILETEARLFVEGDLFSWLDEQPDDSVRAVVAMHVVEHLPLDLQIRLVFEARRILVSGGALILETPNAFSITTAATNFWLDPTHERPVHPLLLEFLADQAGFGATELRPLHPVTPPLRGNSESPELVADLSERLLGCGDIALVARR